MVRASETVEGRGRLYRSRRARDRAAAALRTATLQRLLPRLGLGPGAPPPAVVTTVAQRSGADPGFVSYHLFGPPPATDHDLLQLARALDDIERQVTTRDTTISRPDPHPTDLGIGARGAAGVANRARQGRRRAGGGRQRPGDRAAVSRPCAAGRRSGSGEDAAGPGAGGRTATGVQAGAVHPRPDARRRHRFAGVRRAHRRVRVPAGSGVHQPAAGRRDQPHPAQNTGRAARGDGGASGQRGRRSQAAARPVHRRRDPEPDRIRGHLPVARSATRPLPAQAERDAAAARLRDRHPRPARARLRSPRPVRDQAGGRAHRAGGRARKRCDKC